MAFFASLPELINNFLVSNHETKQIKIKHPGFPKKPKIF